MIYMCCILILASDVKVCIPESLLVSKCSPTHNAFVPHICTAHHWSSWFFAYRKVLHESPYICRVVDCSHMYLIFFYFSFQWTADGMTGCWYEQSILLWYDRAILCGHNEAVEQPTETEVCLMFITTKASEIVVIYCIEFVTHYYKLYTFIAMGIKSQ
jgi:hypothetical protein